MCPFFIHFLRLFLYITSALDDVYIYIYIYRYHTMIDVYTVALLPTKPSSDDDSGFRYGFGAEPSLPQTLSAPVVTHDAIRLCWIDVTLWDCHINADAVRALSWIFFIYFLLSDGERPRLVKNAEVELVMKFRHPTSIGNILVIQPLFSQILVFSNSRWCT